MEYSHCLVPGPRTSGGRYTLIKVRVVRVLRTPYTHHKVGSRGKLQQHHVAGHVIVRSALIKLNGTCC